MNTLVLLKNGTIRNGDSILKFSDLESLFYSKPFGVLDATYDEIKNCFILSIADENGESEYELKLSPEREALLKNGIVDPYIQRLMDLTKEKKQEKKMREIDGQYVKTGELPKDYNELVEYSNYLMEQYNDTKTEIVKGRIFASSPAILAAVAVIACKYGFSDINLIFQTVVGASVGITSGFMSLLSLVEVLTGESHPTKESIFIRLGRLKADSRAYGERINLVEKRIADVNSYSEVMEDNALDNSHLLIDKTNDSIQTKEAKRIEKYRKEFLREVMNVRDLIVELPLEEKSEYAVDLDNILSEYFQECNNLMTQEDLVKNLSEGASNFFADLNDQELKKLKELEINVRRKCIIIESSKDFEEVKSSIDALSDESIGSVLGHKM